MGLLRLLVGSLLLASSQALFQHGFSRRSSEGHRTEAAATSRNGGDGVMAQTSSMVSGHAARRTDRRRAQHGAEEGGEEASPDWAYVMGILGTAATMITGYVLEQRHVSWIPEAAVGLMIGFLIAAVGTDGWIGPLAFDWAIHMRFDFEFFMTYLLPPIIFEAGYNMVRARAWPLQPPGLARTVGVRTHNMPALRSTARPLSATTRRAMPHGCRMCARSLATSAPRCSSHLSAPSPPRLWWAVWSGAPTSAWGPPRVHGAHRTRTALCTACGVGGYAPSPEVVRLLLKRVFHCRSAQVRGSARALLPARYAGVAHVRIAHLRHRPGDRPRRVPGATSAQTRLHWAA